MDFLFVVDFSTSVIISYIVILNTFKMIFHGIGEAFVAKVMSPLHLVGYKNLVTTLRAVWIMI